MRLRIILLTVLTGATGMAADWPQFRGPHGDGVADAEGLPSRWGGLLDPPAWQTDLPGTGWSSPIVVGDSIWLTAAQQTALDQDQAQRRLDDHKEKYGAEVFQADAAVELMALEVDPQSGRLLRRVALLRVEHPEPIHVINSYASPTPVGDGKRLYCHFGSLGTVALQIETGRVRWTRRYPVEDITGPAASPVLHDGRLILVRDGCDQQFVVALDAKSGEQRWKAQRPPIEATEPKHRRGFSTPLLIAHQGRTQLIAPAPEWVVSYDPRDGRELWRARMADGHALVPRPVYRDGLVYACSGYPRAELVAVAVDGSGDVSTTHVRWRHDKQVPLIASPLVHGDELYMVSGLGIASCLDRRTGELLWKQRLEGSYASTPLLADGKLYFTSKEGTTTVVRPGREYLEISRNKLYGETMASMAVSGQSLLLRTASTLYCLRKSEREP